MRDHIFFVLLNGAATSEIGCCMGPVCGEDIIGGLAEEKLELHAKKFV